MSRCTCCQNAALVGENLSATREWLTAPRCHRDTAAQCPPPVGIAVLQLHAEGSRHVDTIRFERSK